MKPIKPWYALPQPQSSIKQVAIIGGGLAGMSLAYHLTQHNFNVLIIDQAQHLPAGASANQVALIKPQLSPDHNLSDQYLSTAFNEFLNFSKAYPELILQQGILELSCSDKLLARHQAILQKRQQSLAHYLTQEAASDLAGIHLEYGGLYFEDAFLLAVPQYYQLLKKLSEDKLQIFRGAHVKNLNWLDGLWQLELHSPHTLKADAVIFAHGYYGFETFIDQSTLVPCPGQLSFIKPHLPINLKCTLSFDGYLTPMIQGQYILGASFRHHEDTDINLSDHQQSLASLQKIAPAAFASLEHAPWQGWCALRTTSPDHLPLIGGVPIKEAWLDDFARIKFGDFRKKQYPDCSYYPNLYMSLAHGSKGVLSSFYAAKIVATLMREQTLIIDDTVWSAVHPARFWLRQLKNSR